MPTFVQTQTLQYAHREDDIATVGEAIDLLGKGETTQAIRVLMAYRNALIDAQAPILKAYDPREERI